jgi:hypothetical protein
MDVPSLAVISFGGSTGWVTASDTPAASRNALANADGDALIAV